MIHCDSKVNVRVGSMGEIWRLTNPQQISVTRGNRVICRTGRGLEMGCVISSAPASLPSSGTLIRRATTEDELLETRLDKFKQQAVNQCRHELTLRGPDVVLLEVDHLFDGRTLIFHFLGQLDSQVQELTDRLVQAYEKKARLKHFAKLLADGCGPGCGTQEAGGCGTAGGCAVCVVASACNSKTS